jgi:catechol 2,3-dioxygenase
MPYGRTKIGLDFYSCRPRCRPASSRRHLAGVGAPHVDHLLRPHDIAFLDGPQGKLHHFAFGLKDWSEILRAGQLFSMDDVPVDIGPTQHGITRGETIYFFDPSGNRNEVFAGGYEAFPDRPAVIWTPDQLGKGIFYIDRELNDRFTTVLT